MQLSRRVSYELYRYAYQAPPIQKLTVIEVTEATGNVMFSCASKVAQEIRESGNKELKYFGDFHLDVETGHAMGSSESEKFVADLCLDDELRAEMYGVVDNLFSVFSEFTDELLAYSMKHELEFHSPKTLVATVS